MQRVTDIFTKNDGRSRSLAPRGIIGPFQDIQVGNSTLQAMERVHNRDGHSATLAGIIVRNNDFGDACGQFLWADAKDVPQEVNANQRSIHCSFDDRSLGRLVVHLRYQHFTSERIGQFLRGLALPEIVDILGGIRAISVQFLSSGIKFCPKVQRLSTDYKGAIFQREVGGNI